MRFGVSQSALALAAASAVVASPAAVDPRVVRPANELAVRDMEVARSQYLEKRLSTSFDLTHTWDNEVLFGGASAVAVTPDGTVAGGVGLEITCVDCWTKGSIAASLTSEDIIDPVVRLDFSAVEAYIDLDVKAAAGVVYSLELFSTATPAGLGLPGLSLGINFALDLVFSLSAAIDLTGGFYVKVADGSFLEADIFKGEIIDHLFDGLSSKSIPIEVVTGTAIFKADLRLRVQCGCEADLEIIGIGAGADVGIYANLIEFVAELEETPTCDVQTIEFWDLNVAAYAALDVEFDFKTIGAVPSISTTLLTSPTYTQCWKAHSPGETATITASVVPVPDTTSSVAWPAPTATGSAPGGGDVVTSTVYTTTLYTITSCAATVVNCPASLQSVIVVTSTVDAFTTVCPVTADITYPAAAATTKPAAAPTVTVTDVVTLSPVATPIVNSWTGAPAPAPTPAVPAAEHAVTAPVVPVAAAATSTLAAPSSSYAYGNGSWPSAAASAGFTSTTAPLPAYTAGAGRASGAAAGLLVALAAGVAML